MSETIRWVTSKITGFRGRAIGLIQTRLFSLWARCWGVKLGHNSRIQGWPILFRANGAKILLGERLALLSSLRANFAGVNRPCYIAALTPEATITIGNDCGFTSTVISGRLSITLGNHVLCGANTTITDTDWHHTDPSRRTDSHNIPAAPVIIEDNVWLGMNCTVLKGVRIGRDTVVAAGSVVATSLPPGVIAAGVPARVRRTLTSQQTEEHLEAQATGDMETFR